MNIKLYCLQTINDEYAPYSITKDKIYEIYNYNNIYYFLDDDNMSVMYSATEEKEELIHWIKTQKDPIFILYEDWLANHREEQINSIL
jgi:hypothetical protein